MASTIHDPPTNEETRMPLGVRAIEHVSRRSLSYHTYQGVALIITFLAYATYHLTREATSEALKSASNGGWEPFNSRELLGSLDASFLAVYALEMYFSGYHGERWNLRVFLTVGMLGCGFCAAMFGFGYWLDIHSFRYYSFVQILAAALQSTGWPCVVAVVGNWVGQKRRGLVLGIWNSNILLGNITGSLVASWFLPYGWGWSMFVSGLAIGFMGLVVYLFLLDRPSSVGMSIVDEHNVGVEPLILESEVDGTRNEEEAIGYREAWRIPGVASYALCAFLVKLVAFMFLYWLPLFIKNTEIGGERLSSKTTGNLSTLFNVGGVVGGIWLGYTSDRQDSRVIPAASWAYFGIPVLLIYGFCGHINFYLNATLVFITGVFVNGTYALITTAVSVDLGTHQSLSSRGRKRAMATIIAIIGGTGSAGAAIGLLLAGYISAISWDSVFLVLMIVALFPGLVLTKLVSTEAR